MKEKRTWRRGLALLLAVMMATALLPLVVLANDGELSDQAQLAPEDAEKFTRDEITGSFSKDTEGEWFGIAASDHAFVAIKQGNWSLIWTPKELLEEEKTALWDAITSSSVQLSPGKNVYFVFGEGQFSVEEDSAGIYCVAEVEEEVYLLSEEGKVSHFYYGSFPFEDPTVDPTPEVTVDPTPEVTVDPTPEVTVDPTPEVTVDPTPEVTVDPTPEVTVDPTPEVTVDPTPEVTVDPTPEVTVDPTPEVTVTPTPAPTATPSSDDSDPVSTVSPAPALSVAPTTSPEVILTEEPVPEGSLPEEIIEEEKLPQAAEPDLTLEEESEIVDEAVPLGNLPQTGFVEETADSTVMVGALALAFSLVALGVYRTIGHKKEKKDS